MPAGHDMIIITLREQLKIEFSTETVAQISVFFCEKKNIWNENHKLMLWRLVNKCLSNFCQNNSTIFI